MLLADVAEDYLLHLRHERGLSQNTFYCYKSHLQQYQEWLGKQGFTRSTVTVGFTTFSSSVFPQVPATIHRLPPAFIFWGTPSGEEPDPDSSPEGRLKARATPALQSLTVENRVGDVMRRFGGQDFREAQNAATTLTTHRPFILRRKAAKLDRLSVKQGIYTQRIRGWFGMPCL
ncbi:MAG: hypothetical protein OHK0029_25770 [Armatimonadaceae bacterium]